MPATANGRCWCGQPLTHNGNCAEQCERCGTMIPPGESRCDGCKRCRDCGLPYATDAHVEEAHSNAFMSGGGICWYGTGSAYSAGQCRNSTEEASA